MLDELYEAIMVKDNILGLERLRRRRFDKEAKRTIEIGTDVVCVTWGGTVMPNELRIYGGITGLKIRPYIEKVMQCFKCYKFGHLAKHCKGKKKCMICGGEFHGYCDKEMNCVNCGGGHRPTDFKCEKYQINIEMKKIMANEGLNIEEARERVKRGSGSSRYDRGSNYRGSSIIGISENRRTYVVAVEPVEKSST